MATKTKQANAPSKTANSKTAKTSKPAKGRVQPASSKAKWSLESAQLAALYASHAVIEFELDGTILFANQNFLSTMGYALSEIQGRHHSLFVPPAEAASAEYREFWAALNRGEFQAKEFKRMAKGGKEVWIQASYNPVLNAQGQPYKVIKIATDISAEKLAAAENANVRAMLHNMSASITFANAKNIITYANPSAIELLRKVERYLPVKVDQIIGQSIDVFHKNPHHQRALVADKRNFPFEGVIRIGEESFTLRASRILDVDGEFAGTLVNWECVTQKLANEKAIKDNADREREQAAEMQRKAAVVLDIVNRVAEGNFEVDIPDLGEDAIAQIAAALSVAVDSVKTALKEVRNVATTVSSAAEQLTGASREISAGAQTQASSLEETASSLEEITSTVKQNSDNAQQARQLANGSRDIAEKGGTVVNDAVQAMGEINQSSKRIADIITTIDEIAFQTNLLALNAAVEAARAGEQGRGFAVVAAEVRNLAQRSASAAKEIKTLIQDSVRKVENGTVLVNRSGQTLSEIVNSVKRVTDIVSEIAAASKEQLTGIEQVNKAVSQMDRVTQANASQTEEMSGTAASLLSHSLQLSELVGRFRLEAAAQPAGKAHKPNYNSSNHNSNHTVRLPEAPKATRASSPPTMSFDLCPVDHATMEF